MAEKEERGFVWGQIYIVLAIVFGIIAIVYGIMAFTMNFAPFTAEMLTTRATIAIVMGSFQTLSGIGLWARKKWGLYLTYFVLAIHLIGTIADFILYLANVGELSAQVGAGFMAGRIIAFAILSIIFILWFGYFIRRRHMFK